MWKVRLKGDFTTEAGDVIPKGTEGMVLEPSASGSALVEINGQNHLVPNEALELIK